MSVDTRATTGPNPRLTCSRRANIMEVCGTHSHALARFGIRQLLPPGVRMLSGPGCPVCVTPTNVLDLAIALLREAGATVATFGDMMRVPGSGSTLGEEKARGRDVRVVFSPLDAVSLAQACPDREVVFLGVGFETTTPMVAASVLEAERLGVANFSVIPAHKVIPPAMRALLEADDVRIDGFLCPGHVATVIGTAPFVELVEEYRVPCVIAGFDAPDILRGLDSLLGQIDAGVARLDNVYRSRVRPEGNPRAREAVERVFEPADTDWRGLGSLPLSGLEMRDEYAGFDTESRFGVTRGPALEPVGCRCGDVLRGALAPVGCPRFGRSCTPQTPVGACMVSAEGACAAEFRYGGGGG